MTGEFTTIWHRIRPYETLVSIAVLHNTTSDELRRLNPWIDPNNMVVGQFVLVKISAN